MAVIFITKKDGSRQKYRLPSEADSVVSIGRSDDCLISMPDVLGLSGRHCRIEGRGGEYTIIDENSTNGTLCNGERIESRILRRGDVYSIGEASLVFDPETQNAVKIDLAALAEPLVQGAALPAETEAEKPADARRTAASLPPLDAVFSPSSPTPPEHRPEPSAAEKAMGREPAAAGEVSGNEEGKNSGREPAPRKWRVPSGRRVGSGPPHGGCSTPEPAYLRALILLYVAVMLGGAFYAGLTLRHWWVTGRFLPTDGGGVAMEAAVALPASAPTKAASPAFPVAPAPGAEEPAPSTVPGAETVELDDDWIESGEGDGTEAGDDDADVGEPSDSATDDTKPDAFDEPDASAESDEGDATGDGADGADAESASEPGSSATAIDAGGSPHA